MLMCSTIAMVTVRASGVGISQSMTVFRNVLKERWRYECCCVCEWHKRFTHSRVYLHCFGLSIFSLQILLCSKAGVGCSIGYLFSLLSVCVFVPLAVT